MATHHEIFLLSIHGRKHLNITFDSKEKGIIKRTCVPFDFGPSRKYKDGLDRFHLYDLDSPDGKHNLSILPTQLHNIELVEIIFDPKDYVTWTPNWIVARDWGIYS
jgi:hypothetical protein